MLLFSAIVAGCNDDDVKSSEELQPERIYFDYKVTAEEGNDQVTFKFQYRKRRSDGEAVSLPDSARIELDGEILLPDSTKFSGVYYEITKRLADFKGTHQIVFSSADGRQYREDFEFIPFSLQKEIPAIIHRQDLVIQLKDFPDNDDEIRVVMTDTAFNTSWINQPVPVMNGEVHISKSMLARLKNGPIGLELHHEQKRPLKEKTGGGGRLVINYSLKRELELQ